MPLFFEGIGLLVAYLLHIWHFPERLCPKSRFVQLYVTGYVIWSIILINFIFEAQRVLYFTLRLNAGTFDDYDDDWWRIDNIFNK